MLGYVFWVFVVLLWMVGVGELFVWAIDSDGIKDCWYKVFALVAFMAFTLGIFFSVMDEQSKDEQKRCEESGGEWVRTGDHKVWTGKQFIIMDDFQCGQRVPG